MISFGFECPAGVYQKAIRADKTQIDAFGRMSPGAIARYIGDATVEHMSAVGMGDNILRDHGLLWVLARTAIWTQQLPRLGENVFLRTWAGKEKHWLYPRRAVFLSAEGETLISACSHWLLIDQNTRCLAPPSELLRVVPTISIPNEPKPPAMSVLFPAELTEQIHRVVQPHEIDINGHMNNSYYLDWATELLDASYSKTHSLRFLWIEYCKELFVGQCASLRYSHQGDTLFLRGYIEGEDSFSVKMEFVSDSGGQI